MHHHTVRTSYKIFYKKHSIHVLLKHMNGPRRHLIPIPSITIFGIKWKKNYENRLNKLFENERELKKRIKSVWKDIAFSLPEIRTAIKQFAGRLKAVKEREGQCIKMIYG